MTIYALLHNLCQVYPECSTTVLVVCHTATLTSGGIKRHSLSTEEILKQPKTIREFRMYIARQMANSSLNNCANFLVIVWLLVILHGDPRTGGNWIEISHFTPPSTVQGDRTSVASRIHRNSTIKPEHSDSFLSYFSLLSNLKPMNTLNGSERLVRALNASSKVEPLREHQPAKQGTEHIGMLPLRFEEKSIEQPPSRPTNSTISTEIDDFDDYGGRMYSLNEKTFHTNIIAPANSVIDCPVHGQQSVTLAGEELAAFFDFLRCLQASFGLRSAYNVSGKIHLLVGLRNLLFANIEQRIARLWIDNQSSMTIRRNQRRRRRQLRRTRWIDHAGDSDGSMDFPSAEGALLTISFLTFAVFLIKLVLQVINTIKAKHYTYSTFASGSTPFSGKLMAKKMHRTMGDLSFGTDETFDRTILKAINSYKLP
ncbi:uncharacterized protein LOC128272416 isoform X2 [Anopheles cruzii]|uniref:uncharacterized protein LOC128272416 isoform X2 n=1 Tax=Anopheles cruzii TaxID=68878 RepID=UPI0022EC2E5B|nr:uncharacterized protein LOC128272416 isoform X2 [Anopheles cruzii]